MRTKLPTNSTRRGDYDRTVSIVTPSWVSCGPTFRELADHEWHWRRVAHGIPRSWTTAREEAARYLRAVRGMMDKAMRSIVAGAPTRPASASTLSTESSHLPATGTRE